eukprot:s1358_g1.t1
MTSRPQLPWSQDQLVNVRQLCATDAAFAALLADGKVVTWGADGDGGKSENLEKVTTAQSNPPLQEISGTSKAFAAILTDGTVRTWGDPSKGGDCSLVQDKLKHVQRVYPSGRSFAALLSDGHVVSWGEVSDTRGVEEELLDIRYIASSYGAFLALRGDGQVVSWGDRNYGANTNGLKAELSNVQIISGASEGFAAIRADGKIIFWDRLGQVEVKVKAASQNRRQVLEEKTDPAGGATRFLMPIADVSWQWMRWWNSSSTTCCQPQGPWLGPEAVEEVCFTRDDGQGDPEQLRTI